MQVTKIVPMPLSQPPTTYTISDLTQEEVRALAEVAYRIAGDACGPRGFFDRLLDHLRSLGIHPTRRPPSGKPHGRIEF
jgi:hypothetical protein